MINNLNKLPGGVGDETPSDKIDPVQISLGIQIEMEHTNDVKVAQEIAMDHITEDPEYYTKLVKAGLAKEFQPLHNSGFGDPSTPFNDVARAGNGGLKKGNMHGKIGGTSNGQVDGRNSEPIINKTVDIELDESDSSPVRSYDGPFPAQVSPDGQGTYGSGYDFVGFAETKGTIMKKEQLKEAIKKLIRKSLLEQEQDPVDVEAEKETVTITLDKDLATKLHDLLMTQLQPEAEPSSDTTDAEVPVANMNNDQLPVNPDATDGESVDEITFEESDSMDEAKKKWIQNAVSKPGALHKQLGVPAGKKIPAEKLSAAAKKGGKLGKRARLAQTLSKIVKNKNK